MKYNQKMTKATHQINPKTIITQKISRKFQSNYPKIMPLCFIRKIKLMKTNIIHRHQNHKNLRIKKNNLLNLIFSSIHSLRKRKCQKS